MGYSVAATAAGGYRAIVLSVEWADNEWDGGWVYYVYDPVDEGEVGLGPGFLRPVSAIDLLAEVLSGDRPSGE